MTALASPAAARPEFRLDGSVRVGSAEFATLSDYFRSPEFRAAGGRCGTPDAPPLVTPLAPAGLPSDCTMTSTTLDAVYAEDQVFVIQVVFHVIKKTDGTGDVSPERLKSQIEVLNEDYNALPGTRGGTGNNARVKFVLARFDPQGGATPGYEVVTSDTFFQDPGSGAAVNPMKRALAWDTSRYLNIYTNDAGGGGILGYAEFPQLGAGTPEDGVVVLHSSVGRNAPRAAPFDLGRTLTHEVGHYLGLLHTFQSGCGTATAPFTTGDLISDTPREAEPTYGCAPSVSACGTGQLNPIDNYMDYSDDACMTRFTLEQANRLRCSLMNYRTPNTEPKAGFMFAATGGDVTFSDTSSDAESSAGQLRYQWSFGDGEVSTERNPVHHYAAAGMYTVTLEVVDKGSGVSTASLSLAVSGASQPMGPGQDTGGVEASGCAAGGGAASPLVLLALALRRRRNRRVRS